MLIFLLALALTIAFPFILLAIIGVLYTLVTGFSLKLAATHKEIRP